MKIDGKQIANEILQNLKKDIQKLKNKGIFPKLAIVLVGNDPASLAYVKQKEIKAKEIGIETTIQKLPKDISWDKLLKIVKQYGNDKKTHGIIIQQPLPKHIDVQQVINAVPLKKDVDGFLKNSKFEIPIANAVLEILRNIHGKGSLTDWLRSKKIVVMGKGETGGKPIGDIFEKMKIPFVLIDSKTKKPENLTKKADVIISAVGKQNIIKENMVKKGVILISVGLSRGNDGKMHGDYEEQGIKNIASFYTPTPGGVGPVNIAMLLANVIKASRE